MISGTNPHLIIKKIIAYFFTLIIMASIFYFSSQPATKSNLVSKSVTKKIVTAVTKNKNISKKEKNELVKKINNYVRKTAHFFLFLLLGVSIFISNSLSFIKKGNHYLQKNVIISLTFCVFYAITDELHQTFVPGRSCQFTDILIDSFGSISGILITLAIMSLIRKKAVN